MAQNVDVSKVKLYSLNVKDDNLMDIALELSIMIVCCLTPLTFESENYNCIDRS
jgi:hypothetical protein